MKWRLPIRSRRVALVITVSLAVLGMGSAYATTHAASAGDTKQIATATLDHDIRVTLRAVHGSDDSATVFVSLSEFAGGAWKSLGRQPVGDRNGWLWPVVTDTGAICRFSTSDVEPYPIEVRLLLSPSIGCSPATYNFHVDKYDELVQG
jgi:hypothetical protein